MLGFPKIRRYFVGVPIRRIFVFRGSKLGSLYFGETTLCMTLIHCNLAFSSMRPSPFWLRVQAWDTRAQTCTSKTTSSSSQHDSARGRGLGKLYWVMLGPAYMCSKSPGHNRA